MVVNSNEQKPQPTASKWKPWPMTTNPGEQNIAFKLYHCYCCLQDLPSLSLPSSSVEHHLHWFNCKPSHRDQSPSTTEITEHHWNNSTHINRNKLQPPKPIWQPITTTNSTTHSHHQFKPNPHRFNNPLAHHYTNPPPHKPTTQIQC